MYVSLSMQTSVKVCVVEPHSTYQHSWDHVGLQDFTHGWTDSKSKSVEEVGKKLTENEDSSS